MRKVLEYLGMLKILGNPDSPISIQGVKDKLSQFVALEGDINSEIFCLKALFHFFQSYIEEIPTWVKFASMLCTAAQQMCSAAIESYYLFYEAGIQRHRKRP